MQDNAFRHIAGNTIKELAERGIIQYFGQHFRQILTQLRRSGIG